MQGNFLDEILEQSPAEVEEKQPVLQRPRRYKVILLNDDYTPMDFVVHVLMKYFYLGQEKATQVMLDVHYKGKAVCGIFTREIAETKKKQVNDYAVANEHPLLCDMEPE